MVNKNKTQKELLEALDSKPIAYNPSLARLTGSVKAGLALSQLLYWWDRKGEKEYFYKNVKELQEETFLTKEEQLSAIKILKAKKYVTVLLKRIPATRCFIVHVDRILNDLVKLTPMSDGAETDNSQQRQPVVESNNSYLSQNNSSITETTNTEITKQRESSYRGLEDSGFQPSSSRGWSPGYNPYSGFYYPNSSEEIMSANDIVDTENFE